MKILCDTEEEYQEFHKRYEGNPDVTVYEPKDCVLACIWSVEDVRSAKDDDTITDDEAMALLNSIEDGMVEAGNDQIYWAEIPGREGQNE